jgi:hypothetical protein
MFKKRIIQVKKAELQAAKIAEYILRCMEANKVVLPRTKTVLFRDTYLISYHPSDEEIREDFDRFKPYIKAEVETIIDEHQEYYAEKFKDPDNTVVSFVGTQGVRLLLQRNPKVLPGSLVIEAIKGDHGDTEYVEVKIPIDRNVTQVQTPETEPGPPPPIDTDIPLFIRSSDMGNEFYLSKRSTTVGRDRTSDLQIDEPFVSGLHCIVTVHSHNDSVVVYVCDCGSSNGTFLGGARVGDGNNEWLIGHDVLCLGEKSTGKYVELELTKK